MKALASLLVMLSMSVSAHVGSADKLVSEDGYLWFNDRYEFKAGSTSVTNATGDVRVLNIRDSVSGSTIVEKLNDKSITRNWDKEKLQEYLSYSMNGKDIIKATRQMEGKENFSVEFGDLLSERIGTEIACDECLLRLKLSDSEVSLDDIPKHYFSNDQVFLVYSTIYAESIRIDGNETIETKLKYVKDGSGKFFIQERPASIKSEPVFFRRPPINNGTGGGSAEVKVKKSPSYPDRMGP